MTWKYGDPLYIAILLADKSEPTSPQYERIRLDADDPNYPPLWADSYEFAKTIRATWNGTFRGLAIYNAPTDGDLFGVLDAIAVDIMVGDTLECSGTVHLTWDLNVCIQVTWKAEKRRK